MKSVKKLDEKKLMETKSVQLFKDAVSCTVHYIEWSSRVIQ